MVSTEEKQNFIKRFLDKYNLKKRESVWILHYLLTHDDVIEKVHFVEKAYCCPRGIVMTTFCSNEIPFGFYKEGRATNDAEVAFNDVKLNRDKELYIELNFSDKLNNNEYYQVLEDNHYAPKDEEEIKRSQIAEDFLNYSIISFRKKQLIREIDVALDNGNKKDFKMLSKEYNELINNGMNLEIMRENG